MANTHTSLTSLFTAIADKIRKKNGSTATIVADDFPDAIDSILTPTDGTIPTKTSSNLTASGATVTVPAGYYASNASKSVATATQATPTLSINTNNNYVIATCTQSAGYVTGGTKTGTFSFTKKDTSYYTPTTSQQTLFNSGLHYFTGPQYLNAIASAPVRLVGIEYPSSTKLLQFNIGTEYTTLHDFYMSCSTTGSANSGVNWMFTENGTISYILTYDDDGQRFMQFYSSESPPVTLSNGIVTVYLGGCDAELYTRGQYTAIMYAS